MKGALLLAQDTKKVLDIPCIQFWLLPGHKVTTTREVGKVYKVYPTRGPFTGQRRIVGTVSDSRRNCCALLYRSPTGDASVGIVAAGSGVNRFGDPVDHDICQELVQAETGFKLLIPLPST